MKKQLRFSALGSLSLAVSLLALLHVPCTAKAQPNYVPTNGLVGWWPFNGNANDESGNGNNGIVNGATLTTDRFGVANKAFQFGNNKWIAIADNQSLRPSQITLTSWVKMDGAPFTDNYGNSSYPIFYKGQYEVYHYDAAFMKIKQNSGCGSYLGGGWIPWNPNYGLTYNYTTWHFIVGIFDGSNVKLYVDNVLIENYPTTINSIDNCSNAGEGFKIGRVHNLSTLFFNGKIDDLGIWNRALTACEIADLYNAQLGSSNSTSTQNQSSCSSYTWNGTNYSQSGQYQYQTINAAGCDSTATLNLTIYNPTYSSQNETVCTQFIWNGTTYTQSGQYIYQTTNYVGCDSTATLNLTINQPSSSSQTQTALDSYTWPVNGQTYTQSGTYTDTLVNAAGCDSVITLNLTLSFTGIDDLQMNQPKKLVKITDLNGRETPFRKNTVLLFIYEDGTVERVLEVD